VETAETTFERTKSEEEEEGYGNCFAEFRVMTTDTKTA
jgi:hypothetical protein